MNNGNVQSLRRLLSIVSIIAFDAFSGYASTPEEYEVVTEPEAVPEKEPMGFDSLCGQLDDRRLVADQGLVVDLLQDLQNPRKPRPAFNQQLPMLVRKLLKRLINLDPQLLRRTRLCRD